MRADAVSRAVLEQLRELHCLEPEQTVCCALSGGADSVCLLRCLLELRPVLGITITAVHVNHHLRGAESERDRTFCQQLCAGLGVRLAVYDVNPAARAAQEHCSEELAARECRYAAFAQVQADWIATAHTASDQSGNGSAPAGAGSKPAWTDGNSAEKRAVSPSTAAGDTAAGGTVSGITGADLCYRQHQPHRCLHPQPDPASGDSGTGTAEPFCRTHGFLYPAEPAAGGRFPAPAGTGSLCQMAIPERIPFPAWKRFTRRCSSGVLPCCWRRRGSPVKLRCWNGWRHWHGRAAGGICLVLFMLWESRAH